MPLSAAPSSLLVVPLFLRDLEDTALPNLLHMLYSGSKYSAFGLGHFPYPFMVCQFPQVFLLR
jgi:hypothetical protein